MGYLLLKQDYLLIKWIICVLKPGGKNLQIFNPFSCFHAWH